MRWTVFYTVPPGRRRFWVRDEGSPNRPDHATRFDTREQAEHAADEIAENVRGRSGQDARIGFHGVD